MAADDLLIRLGLTGQAETSRGLKQIASDTRQVGASADYAAARAKAMGAAWKESSSNIGIGLGHIQQTLKYATLGMGALAAAGVVWGLSYNSQIQGARQRFKLFSNDVDGLTKQVVALDKVSPFNLTDLSMAVAQLGNAGVAVDKIVPGVRAIANGVAAAGGGTAELQRAALAFSQIASSGTAHTQDINQLVQAGIPAYRLLAQGLGETQAKLRTDLAKGTITSGQAVDILTRELTSGRMAKAAMAQTKTLSGQFGMLKDNAQQLAGTLTQSLAGSLTKDVLPAANNAVSAITKIFGEKGLSNTEKLQQARAAIRKYLGPVADDVIKDIQDAHLAQKLTDEFDKALNAMAASAVNHAPQIVSSFVGAWLNAGPWAMLLSGGWFVRKLGLDKGVLAALKVLRGGGGGKGGIGGLLGGAGARGATPVNPVWVAVTDKAPGKGMFTKVVEDAKKLGPAALAVGSRVAPAALDFGGPLAAVGALAYLGTRVDHNYPTRGMAPVARQAHGTIAPPGFGTPLVPQRSMVQITVNVDGHPVATAVHRDDARVRARK